MPSSAMKAGLAVVVAAAVAGGAYYVYKATRKAAEEEPSAPVATKEEKPVAAGAGAGAATAAETPAAAATKELSEEEVLTMLKQLHGSQQELLLAIATMQQRAEANSEALSQEKIMKIFHDQSARIRARILMRAGDVKEADFQAAVTKYSSNRKIKQLVDMLQQLATAVSKNTGPLPSVDDSFTVEQFLEKLDVFVAAVENNLDRAVQEAQKTGLEGQDLAEEITNLVMMNAREAQDKAFEDMGMTEKLFQACLAKFQADARVQQKFHQLHENNTKRLKDARQAATTAE